MLAKKISGLDTYVNADFRSACVASLLGESFPMDGRVLLPGGNTLRTKDGRSFVFFDEHPIMREIQRWQDGIFTETDEILAEEWRRVSRGIDLEAFKQQFSDLLKVVKGAPTLKDLAALVDAQLSNGAPAVQELLMRGILELMGTPQPLKTLVFNRWLKERLPPLREFAPYAHFCLRTYLIFYLATMFEVVTPRRTNVVDLEYLFYLPFCVVFSSGDKFHAALHPALLREDQAFAPREELKADLKWLAEEWESLTDEQKKERAYDYGSHPPRNPDSITYRVWERNMAPWKPGSGNRAIKMTKEEEKELLEHLQPFYEAIDERRSGD